MKKIIISGLLLSLVLTGCIKKDTQTVISPEEAKAKVVDFINNNLMQPGSEVTMKEITEEGGLYKTVISMSNGQEIISYMTKDGEKFFPQVFEMNEEAGQDQASAPAPEATVADVPKAEKAKVELFVMSHCPYGTQIEKGIVPVLETLGDKVDFELKFCDYLMHGKEEMDEQLNQYCIQENEPEKLIGYLTCFLEDGDGEGCLSQTGINKTKLNSCVAATDDEHEISALFADQSTWKSGRFPQFNIHKVDTDRYGVSGSPSLVVNGQKVPSGRDSANLLATICAGYENPPEECNTELSSAAPSAGFGFSGAGSNTAAECN